MRSLLVDTRPLRESPDYRRLWLGDALSGVGSQLTRNALALQVFGLTRSNAAVGALGAAQVLPLVVVGLYGGVLADRRDRRVVVLGVGVVQALLSVVLAVLAAAGSRVLWPLYALVALQAAASSVGRPARRGFLARLLPPDQRAAASALQFNAFTVAGVTGPALAAVLVLGVGLEACYAVDALTFAASLYAVARLPSFPPDAETAAQHPWRSLREGLAFVRREPVVLGVVLTDLVAVVPAMPLALLPGVNAERFGGHPGSYAVLAAAPAVGAGLGSLLSGRATASPRPGRGQTLAVVAWGAALVGFGLAGSLWLCAGCLALAFVADVTGVLQRTAVLQTATPDRLMGRVASVEFAIGAGGPELGNARAGALAAATSSAVSAVSGGVVSAGLAVGVAAALPALRRYRAPGPAADDRPGEPGA